ncbi:MAG: glycosyltransferase family 2 protein [Candidatus Bathyarchaeota archaeon]|nr:glycosyltransferase family 2 protein [Candidatus Bathyarchaeota archaeon]
MPIHNEERNLHFSLPSLFRLEPDEVVFVMDNCTDRSRQLIEYYARKIDYRGHLKFLEVRDIPKDWNYRVAYLFRQGYRASRNDAILTTAADIVLDQDIRKYIEQFGGDNVKIVSFGLKPYPLDRVYFARKIISLILPRSTFSGVFIFSRKAWLENENEEDAKKVFRAQDTLMFRSIRRRYPARHYWTKSLHLRSRTSESGYYYSRGQVSYQVTKRSPLFVFISSIVYLHPKMFVGYRHAKRMNVKRVSL